MSLQKMCMKCPRASSVSEMAETRLLVLIHACYTYVFICHTSVLILSWTSPQRALSSVLDSKLLSLVANSLVRLQTPESGCNSQDFTIISWGSPVIPGAGVCKGWAVHRNLGCNKKPSKLIASPRCSSKPNYWVFIHAHGVSRSVHRHR